MYNKTGIYYIAVNRCNCHPETCCCDDWVIIDLNGEKFITIFHKKDAEKTVELLNNGLTNGNV